jgi:DnaD and phage-associated domain
MSNARFSILQARAVKDKRISDSQFRTLAALGMYADEDGWCFPSLTTLGADLGKSKQAVGRDTVALRRIGYLEVTARYDKNGARRSCLYRLKFDLPRQPVVDTPSTNHVDTPSTSEVDVNDPINDPNEIERSGAQIFKALESLMGALNTSVPRYVDGWLEKHTAEWILKAVDIAKEKGARSEKYVDKILIGWEANGYPKTREQQIEDAKKNGANHAKRNTNNSGNNKPADEYDPALAALGAEILAERRAKQSARV